MDKSLSLGICVDTELGLRMLFGRTLVHFIGVVLTALALSACVAGTGPLTKSVIDAGGKISSDVVFDVVELTYDNARIIADFRSAQFQRRFGAGGQTSTAVIGAGDVLEVVIYEAGADGLFSTSERKATPLTVTVQPDGTASIPYVGSIRFAGKTVEQARLAIVDALQNKAIEPDATVSISQNVSRTVAVNGDVGGPGIIPLKQSGNRITEVIAMAGGARNAPYDTAVTVTRGDLSAKVMLQLLLDSPGENIYAAPGDQIYLSHEPQTFTVLGSTPKVGKVPFGSERLTLVEASAMAGGGDNSTADPKGYFVFRFEDEDVYTSLVGSARFAELIAGGMRPDEEGRFPIVYRIDMSRPQSFLTGQIFPVNNRDVVYISRSPSIDFQRFIGLVSSPIGLANSVQGVIN
jgi:polysaccharide export outer membrane protein